MDENPPQKETPPEVAIPSASSTVKGAIRIEKYYITRTVCTAQRLRTATTKRRGKRGRTIRKIATSRGQEQSMVIPCSERQA